VFSVGVFPFFGGFVSKKNQENKGKNQETPGAGRVPGLFNTTNA
jgi:hypothetical protein